MITPISDSSAVLYRKLIKPVLFRFPADTVHESMIVTGAKLQHLAPFRGFMRTIHAYQNPTLHQKLLGLQYRNPVGLSAGLDKDAKLIRLMESIGFGFVECGSVTRYTYDGNPKPWYARLPKTKSIVVNSGLRSEGAERVIERVASYPAALRESFPTNISIARTNSADTSSEADGIADYVDSMRLWELSGLPAAYTINISCPNTYGGEPFTNPRSLSSLLRALDQVKPARPVFVKLPIDKTWKESEALLAVCAKHNVQGVTLGNLFKDRTKIEFKDPFDMSQAGNFSGKPCWSASNELLARTYLAYGDRFVLSGVGGVFNADDAYTKIKLGASLVQIITGLIFQGPSVVGEINKGIARRLKVDGFTNVHEAVGIEANNLVRGI